MEPRFVVLAVFLGTLSLLSARGSKRESPAPRGQVNEEVGVPAEGEAATEEADEGLPASPQEGSEADEEAAVPEEQVEPPSTGKGDPKTIDFSAEEVMATLADGREQTVLRGNVRVRVNDQRMVADELQIYGENYTILTGEGEVRIRDDIKKIYIEGSDFTYDRENKILRIRGEISIEDQENEVIVRASYLEYFEKQEILNLQINVRVFNKDITTKSEIATYLRKTQTLELTGSPVVNKGSDRYESTLITVDLDTREVILEGGATGVIETE